MHVQVCHFRDKSVIGIHSHTRRYTQESPVGTARHTISPPTIKLELSSRNKDELDGSPRVQELVTCSMGGVAPWAGAVLFILLSTRRDSTASED